MANGLIMWRGASELDGAPIVLVATGLERKSTNAKTGDLIQTWIMRDDMNPRAAVNSGNDASVCGGCKLRGDKGHGRSCYVRIDNAPRNVWDCANGKKIYPTAKAGDTAKAFAGRHVRLGAYGDPAAVPVHVWAEALSEASVSPGYTHQWRTCNQQYRYWLMASCDTAEERAEAKAMGWRTFRVRRDDEPLAKGEVKCPASKEAGYKTTCEACGACAGLSAKAKADISIISHGAGGGKSFAQAQAQA